MKLEADELTLSIYGRNGEDGATHSTKNPGSAFRQLEAPIEARFYFRETLHMHENKVALYIAMGNIYAEFKKRIKLQ